MYEIAAKHPKSSKLRKTVKEADAPLNEYHRGAADDELVKNLLAPLGESVARRLAATPFFKSSLDTGVRPHPLSLLSDSLFDFGVEIVIEPDRVSIRTDNPGIPRRITPLWMDYCEIHILPTNRGGKTKRIAARKVPS